ncbi:MAG: amino acid--tRNA ligase-related protein, partial [Patescibacteria group bacterium]
MATRLDTIRSVRIEKLAKLKKLGVNPYPSKINLKGKLTKISEARNLLEKQVLVAGRLMGLRGHGKVMFADLKDETDQIQLLFRSDILKKKYDLLELFDIGDFVAISGKVVNTQAGEITVDASDFELLSKSIRPLPSTWHGLKDIEERFRKRYLDLILNPDVRERFNIRTKIVSGVRKYLDGLGFMEVETPTLQSIYGGANAKPFKTHLNALVIDMY